jgi:hypothetical protein
MSYAAVCKCCHILVLQVLRRLRRGFLYIHIFCRQLCLQRIALFLRRLRRKCIFYFGFLKFFRQVLFTICVNSIVLPFLSYKIVRFVLALEVPLHFHL